MGAPPRLRIFAGPNCSGKSTLKDELKPEWLGSYLNPDDIQRDLTLAGFDVWKLPIEVSQSIIDRFWASTSILPGGDRPKAPRSDAVRPLVAFNPMTWEELSESHRESANSLMRSGNLAHHRGVCSRAYYSSYALLTSKLPSGTRFGRGRNNPEHTALPGYVNQIPDIEWHERKWVKSAIRRLRQRREDADYRPGVTVTVLEAKEALRDVEEIRSILGDDSGQGSSD